ncbi:DUF2264 domain-containing protein [Nesterenkonia haasae]|uniref:DUF2264 domain-containing protein n=1 Tax=Nesterenkonia haasae TaxID=2587813 RepID=UPI001391F4BD|nr:DUF2264 domain-containing protein [Nesterenkonia haasae]NDK31880.1 DUF2264 domain-containing protein [Nesterenkonia haasae]
MSIPDTAETFPGEGHSAHTAALSSSALNFQISPYTGYTRDHWEAVADALLARAWRWASPQGGRLNLPGPSSASGVRSDGLEGYARTFLAAAFRVAGADGADPHDWLSKYAEGLVAGTRNPGGDDAESWPLIRDYDVFGQPMVESASIALGLRMTKPWLWNTLSAQEQDRVAEWLRGALVAVPAPNNWYLFPFTVAGFLESVGRRDALTSYVRERGLQLVDSWYRGEGWYTDGDGGSFDYYNGWALHLYPVLDELLASRETDGAPHPGMSVWGARLREHLTDYGHFFAANGAPVYFGRSMTYRFAASAAVGLGAVTGNTPLSAGASRRIVSESLKHFLDRGALDEHGVLTLGWYGKHAATVQKYSGPGSPYWASKAFVALLAPPNDPLWVDTEQKMPVETRDHVIALKAPGFLLHSTQEDGIVRLHNHGSDHLRAVNGEAGSATDPLYSRWVYSTHSGPTSPTNQPDNDLSVFWRGERGVRTRIHPLGTGVEHGIGWAASWHRPVFSGRASAFPGLKVTSVVVVYGASELRIHAIRGAPQGSSLQSSGWATRFGSAKEVTSTLLPLAGWERPTTEVAPEGTAFEPIVEVPRLRAELAPGVGQVLVALASLTGVESDRSDGIAEVENLSITENQVTFQWAGHNRVVVVDLDLGVVATRGVRD